MSFIEGSLVAGRFSIEGFAGKGGMGEVFRARDATTGELVALKLLHADEGGIERVERFHREVRLLADLRHPGIVGYVGHGRAQDGRPFLAMEWLAGKELGQRLAQGSLGMDECTTLVTKVADALAVAHRHGAVHRDIKPSNLFLRDDRIDRVTLLDFGIARWVLAGTALTRTGTFIGTPGYMAPEQARGEFEVGPSADIFALGCVLFECLTGRPAFMAHDAVGVLAKVLFENPPPVETLRADTPPALAALLARMLDKDPARRPPDAAALRDELCTLELTSTGQAVSLPPRTAPAAAVLTGDAMKLLCVVLAVPHAGAPGETLVTAATLEQAFRDGLRFRLARLGGQVEWLADGSLAVIVPPASSALDQVIVAARSALAVQEVWPESRVAVTTGRGVLQERFPAGEVIDRAVSLIRTRTQDEAAAARSGGPSAVIGAGVWLDALSAKLLEPRFVITTATGQATLMGERASADESRPLLGRPTPCVGREQELSILSVAFEGCVENAEPAGVVVVAPPGMGKSRLKHEFLRRLRARSPEVQVLFGSGTQMSAGSPYGLLAEAVRRLCDVQSGEPPAVQEEKVRRRVALHVSPGDTERVGEFVAVLCGIAVERPSVLLCAAQGDPKIMTEQIQRSFVEFLGAEPWTRPLLLVLEDLHWGDAGTVKLIDAALLELRERPLFVLAFARPELHERFPKLWEGRTVQRIRLPGLSKKAAERLITAVLDTQLAPHTMALIIEQAAGNALFLEELIRGAAEGKLEQQPETVLAMLQARLSCLDPPALRVLCSASIFGQTFARGGVLALLGRERDAEQTETLLDGLVHSELIEKQRSSHLPEDKEYKFRHMFVRDAAYGLLPEQDRTLGHRLAGGYLEKVGQGDPMMLAEHAYLGGNPSRAAQHYLRAAEQSYQSEDYEALRIRVERGMACGASGEDLGRLLALKLEVCMWREDWEVGIQSGRRALDLLPRGSAWWSKVMGTFAFMAGSGEFESLVEALIDTEPEPDAIAAHCVALGLAGTILHNMGLRAQSLALLGRLEHLRIQLPENALVAHGVIDQCQFFFGYWMGEDPWKAFLDAQRSGAAFAAACARRYHGITQCIIGLALATLGQREEAEQVLCACLDHARRTSDALFLSVARTYWMLFLAEQPERGRSGEIIALARQVLESDATEFTVGAAHAALGKAFMAEGRLGEAREQAEKALGALQRVRAWRPMAYRTLIEILLREERAGDARQVAEEALRCLDSFGGRSGYSEVSLRLSIAEAQAAAGDMGAARSALAAAVRAIDVRVGHIPDAGVRARYLAELPENARVQDLARVWLDFAI